MPSLKTHDALALAALVKKGEVTPLELAEAAIRRIEKLNPQLNAVIHPMFEEGRKVAQSNLPDGPFRGVPFLLKDLITTYAGAPCSKGCKALKNYIATTENELMRRFRATGVVTLGRTNTPEFGLAGTTEPEAFGPSRNAADPSDQGKHHNAENDQALSHRLDRQALGTAQRDQPITDHEMRRPGERRQRDTP